MSEKKTTKSMLFVLGLFLIVLGVGTAMYTTEVTAYSNIYGNPVPYKQTTQPYSTLGMLMTFVGIISLIIAFNTQNKQIK